MSYYKQQLVKQNKTVKPTLEQTAKQVASMLWHHLEFHKQQMDGWDYARDIDTSGLHKIGFNRLGAGYFSIVLEHKMVPDHVIKVTVREDEGYESWVEFAMDNQDNPLCPRVLHKEKHGELTIYVLQKYDAIRTSNADELTQLQMAQSLFHYSLSDDYAVGGGHLLEWFAYVSRTPLEYVRSVREFLRRSKVGNMNVDLHSDNLMLHNGRIVITDPLV